MKLARNQFTPPQIKRPAMDQATSITLALIEAIERWASTFAYSAPQMAATWGQAQADGGVEFPRPGGSWAAWIALHTPVGSRNGKPRIRVAWPADSRVAQTEDMCIREDGRIESSYTADELSAALTVAGYDIPHDLVARFVELAAQRSPLTMAVALITAFDRYHAEQGTAPWDMGSYRKELARAAVDMGIGFYWFTPGGGYEEGGPDKWKEWATK